MTRQDEARQAGDDAGTPDGKDSFGMSGFPFLDLTATRRTSKNPEIDPFEEW
jgi:hypothetical protein